MPQATPDLDLTPTTSTVATATPSTSTAGAFTHKTLIGIRTSLLEREGSSNNSEDIDEEDNELILVSRKRLREICAKILPRCTCTKNYIVQFENDGFETTIKRSCKKCRLRSTSLPTKCPTDEIAKTSADVFKSNAALIYHSILEDYGFAGMKRLQAAMGIKPMGNYKFGRYLKYLYEEMEKHYKARQEDIYERIRKYYREELDILPDENGNLNIDVSYDGTWMKPSRKRIIPCRKKRQGGTRSLKKQDF